MSFNRRGPDRGPDRRRDRPERPGGGDRPRDRFEGARRPAGDWQPRERPGGERGGPPNRDRPYAPRSDRPFTPRPRFEAGGDEGAMSIRLDPRRAGILKQLAADAGTRPGELVRIWVEERLDAERRGEGRGAPASDLASIVQALGERVAALERAASAGSATQAEASGTGSRPTEATPEAERDEGAEPASTSTGQADVEGTAEAHPTGASQDGERPKRRRNAVSAAPAGERVALHDEMIAVIAERGPLPASELAAIITERGRYTPPRSGKPLDALTVSARVSNPTYRGRFTRAGGRIGLAEG